MSFYSNKLLTPKPPVDAKKTSFEECAVSTTENVPQHHQEVLLDRESNRLGSASELGYLDTLELLFTNREIVDVAEFTAACLILVLSVHLFYALYIPPQKDDDTEHKKESEKSDKEKTKPPVDAKNL